MKALNEMLSQRQASTGGSAGIRVNLVSLSRSSAETQSPAIPKITYYNDFEYGVNGEITAWRYYGIGVGEEIDKRFTRVTSLTASINVKGSLERVFWGHIKNDPNQSK